MSEERPGQGGAGGERDEGDERRGERWSSRESRRAEREARHAEREARRAERRARHLELHAMSHGAGFHFDAGDFGRGFMADFGDAAGDSYSETVEGTFSFTGMPRLRVRNVSGATSVRRAEGAANEIHVVARKRVMAGSEDRAKRLLENVEVRMDQRGQELVVEPHLYEQERGWLDLFKGKRFRVDFDITVPAECAVDGQTVSGELNVEGTRGPVDVQTVSGNVRIEDVQGPLRLKSVSGDVDCRRYVGHVEGNAVSGDLTIAAALLRSTQLHTVSGDIGIEGRLDADREHRLKTISGDVELALADGDVTIDYRTASGDVECDLPARIVRHGRKDYNVVVGAGRGRVAVKTVSGDLTIGGTSAEAPAAAEAAATTAERASDATEPTAPDEVAEAGPRPEVRAVLERLARGELGVDDAAAALDEARGRR